MGLAGGGGSGPFASTRCDSSRHQAVELDPGPRWSALANGFRLGQASGRGDVEPQRGVVGHSALHESGTGVRREVADRSAYGHLQPGRHVVRAGHGQTGLRRRLGSRDHHANSDGRAAAAAAAAAESAPRSGNNHPQVHCQRAGRAIRHGSGGGGRPASVCRGPSDQSASGESGGTDGPLGTPEKTKRGPHGRRRGGYPGRGRRWAAGIARLRAMDAGLPDADHRHAPAGGRNPR